MWTNHKVTVDEANEALDEDPVILVRETGIEWPWGANGWPANRTDRAK
jgi:hypothetical protein